ncbi:MAG: hypothetical protein EBS35_08505 [Bacteroidetes bacterium]|nr:hypothetical protein [Bacteroidota bacterium]
MVQGPPGTGKSQLIANLMADAMGSKKSVLLVCQKRVALEVVQKRLNEVGLGQYVGLWSDFKKDRAPVYAQMAQTIQNLEEAEAQNQNLDTVLLERKFGQACNQLEQITQNLESWKAALFDSSLAGTSVRELYLAKEYEQKSIFKSNLVLHFKLDEWNQYLLWLNKYWDDLWLTLGPDSNFRNRRNWFLNGETEFSNLPEAWKSICRNLNLLYRKYKSACLTEQEKKPFAILSQKKVLIEAILMSDNEVGTQVPYLLMDFKGILMI